MNNLLFSNNLLTGSSTGAESSVAKLRRASEKALINNLLINPVYAGAATVTQAAAVDPSTTVFQQNINRCSIKRGGVSVGTTTWNTSGTGVYAFQNLVGTQDFGFAIDFYTDSATVTLKIKRQTSYGFKLAINDAYISVSSSTLVAWSTVDPTYNYVVVAGLTGINKIRLEVAVDLTTSANPVHCGHYTTAFTSTWPTDYKTFGVVVGDSFTHGSGSNYQVNDYVNQLGILLGLDDLWALGYSGTGYVASLSGQTFTTGAFAAGSTVIPVANTSGLVLNGPVLLNGTGDLSPYFSRHTQITTIVANTSITVSKAALAAGSAVSLYSPNQMLTPTDLWNTSTGQSRLAFDLSRMSYTPDVFFFALGLNDDANATGYQTEMISQWALARSLAPNALIIVIGVPSTAANGSNSGSPNYISAFSQNNENNIKGAFTTWNDPNSLFIADCTSPLGGPGGSRQWGTGNTGATNTTGNNDVYCYTDGTHPSTAGHAYRASWIANSVRAALKTLP